jgi:hypothetical protein
MDSRSRLIWSIAAGAAVGGALGYLFFTDDGRRLRSRLEPHVGDLIDEVSRWRGTIDKVKAAAGEGRRSVAGLVDEFQKQKSAWGDAAFLDDSRH